MTGSSMKKTRLLLVGSAHIYKTDNGKFYTPSIYDDSFFKRYLDVFTEVYFVAKTKYVKSVDESQFIQIKTDRLTILELPWHQGVRELISVLPKLIAFYRSAGPVCDCVIYRVCQLESYFSFFFRKEKIPLYLEVVNDPETFDGLPMIFKRLNIHVLKMLIKNSNGASFVTDKILQNKYLPAYKKNDPDFITGSYSSVELPNKLFRPAKVYDTPPNCFKIVHVANSIYNDVKGHITVMRAAKHVTESGYSVKVFFIGDGAFVNNLRELAKEMFPENGIVNFTGRLHDRRRITDIFDCCDLYVYPTKLEGLPRSLIEAMAAGLPCLSTPIAGIPELLEEGYLFSPTDHFAFAKKIIYLINNVSELEKMSSNNISVARGFEKQVLDHKRFRFYSKIRSQVLSKC